MATGPVQTVLAEYGQDMLERLGIWLPETVEIGLKLRDLLKLNLPAIPISMTETLQVLADRISYVGGSPIVNQSPVSNRGHTKESLDQWTKFGILLQ